MSQDEISPVPTIAGVLAILLWIGMVVAPNAFIDAILYVTLGHVMGVAFLVKYVLSLFPESRSPWVAMWLRRSDEDRVTNGRRGKKFKAWDLFSALVPMFMAVVLTVVLFGGAGERLKDAPDYGSAVWATKALFAVLLTAWSMSMVFRAREATQFRLTTDEYDGPSSADATMATPGVPPPQYSTAAESVSGKEGGAPSAPGGGDASSSDGESDGESGYAGLSAGLGRGRNKGRGRGGDRARAPLTPLF